MRVLTVLLLVVGLVVPAQALAQTAADTPVEQACPASVPRAGFRDVARDATHARSIDCAAWWGVVRGRTARRYVPGALVTREQSATLLAKLFSRTGATLPASPGDRFTDDDTSPHQFSINRLGEVGVVSGSGGRYRPRAQLNRGQTASLLVRAYQQRTGQTLPAGPDAFDDDNGSIHEPAIDAAAAAGLLRGVGTRAFDPHGDVTRAQMASFVTNTLQAVAEAGVVAESPADLQAASDLRTFGDCEPLLGHLKERALDEVSAYGLGGGGTIFIGTPVAEDGSATAGGGEAEPSAAPDADSPGSDFSGTNNQEAGVDEADVVKTDGRRIFSVVDGTLRAVDVSVDPPQLVGSMEVSDTYGYGAQLLLDGNRLIVMSTSYVQSSADDDFGREQATVQIVDVTDASAMTTIETVQLDGRIAGARMIGGVARIVLTNYPDRLAFTYPEEYTDEGYEAAVQHNRHVIEDSTITDWLPRYQTTTREGVLVNCDQLRRPPEYSGLSSTTVVTVDPDAPFAPEAAAAVLGGGDTIYASTTSLYVATTRWDAPARLVAQGGLTTEIHRFGIDDPASARYRSSGKVPGYLLNQFSMSEHNDVLRVATTVDPFGQFEGEQAASSSMVTTLQETDGSLVQLGQVGDLGRGERIYAVRFIGDLGYVVTFRQVDPLYTLDLSDPAAPRVLGELKILGYSAYLHPAGDGLLIGVGQDATEEGQQLGTQLSLFDVSDPASPQRLYNHRIDGGYSEVEYDHHAFLYWPPTGTTVIPVERYNENDYFIGAAGFEVHAESGIDHVGDITHGGVPDDNSNDYRWPSIRRSVVIGDRLYTLSALGVKASDLSSLADEGWVAFPPPPQCQGDDCYEPRPVD